MDITTLIFWGIFFILIAFVISYCYYVGSHSLFWAEQEEEKIEKPPTEPMIPQSLVNKMIEDLKEAHNEDMVGRVAAARLEAMRGFKNKEKVIRADAIKRHKNVIKGKTTEHLIPYMDEFTYDPSDCRFMGSPIDIVVFDGLSGGDVKEVVFLEIKTGPSANLSTRERKVRDAIKDGRVSWRLIRKNDKEK